MNFIHLLSVLVIVATFGCGMTKHKKDEENNSPTKPQTPYQLIDNPSYDLTDSNEFLMVVRISPDHKLFATAGLDGKIRVYDIETKKILHILETHNNYVDHLAFTKDSQRLFSSSPDKTIRLYELNRMGDGDFHHHAVESKRFDFNSYVQDFSLSPDESKLVAAVYGQGLVLVDIATAAVELTIKTPVMPFTMPTDNPFRRVVYLPDGKSFVTGNKWGVHQWDLTTGKELREFKWEFKEEDILHNDDLYAMDQVELSSDGTKLVASSSFINAGYFVWDVATGNRIHTFNKFNASTPTPGSHTSDYKMEHCKVAKFSRDGTKLIVGISDEIRVWDIDSMKELYRFGSQSTDYFSIDDFDLSGDGKYLIHTKDKGVRIWQLDGQL